ncbi:MAG: hypothetical protein OXF11_10875 [Deltaproteobacteria bacterium]|nr:hypothetical protein [Deltaproteobacteria bacterium]
MAAGFLQRFSVPLAGLVVGAFLSGFLGHLVYARWTGPAPCAGDPADGAVPLGDSTAANPASDRDLPEVDVMEIERLQGLAGALARVRGRVYRVGHSSKSNTWFLDFGPSRSAFTAVIFSSAVDAFERADAHPNRFQGKEVELTGRIKDDPKYGLEMILEGPTQIRLVP